MGFSIPKLEIPKIPELDVNAAVGQLTQTFDPSADVGAVSGNISSQLAALESMRSQLGSIRDNAQKAAATADFKALSTYTTGLQAMTDVSCIMSSSKPSFTPMTPESLSLPLLKGAGGLDASALSGGLGVGGLGDVGSGILSSDLAKEAIGSYLGVDPAIVDAAMSGDVETLTSPDTLTDLAIAGAGAYVSGMTGGVIPPQVASSVIDSVAGDAINSTISGTMSGDLSAMASIQPTGLSGTSALGVAKSAIGADPSGGMLEGALTQTQSGVINRLSDASISNITPSQLANIASSSVSSVGASNFGPNVGGINTTDVSSLTLSAGINVLNRASETGNISGTKNMLKMSTDNGLPKESVAYAVKTLGSNIDSNPGTRREYSELYNEYVGIEESDVFNILDENPDIYESGMAESIYGKDEARKRKAIMDIAAQRRFA